ncbi:SMI1/KNR4 family protein [Flavobacterium sp. HBTb2-11-1]|uniref:SMI1/KNR4 family protein n=1 Tax=Flavobacterium sp. HBTb2-11-1 TaxID=2692212 RepID=UPI00136D54C2|nr:SMI1/KNR4 family protein [Flavobacterium sp. HBTb2-11-1]MXO07490.1 SMI1/KNR4 family protein [Flavobacterium sp. HBTb2-11-1]
MKQVVTASLVNVCKSKLDIFHRFMRKGATDVEIQELEKFVDQKLPASYVKLLKTYNGEKRTLGFLGGFGYLSIEGVKREWLFFKNAPDTKPEAINQVRKITNVLYSTKRIPFAHDGSGNFLCLDFIPNTDGILGQVIYLPCGDPEPISVVSDSFDDFLNLMIRKIQSKKLKLVDEREDWDAEDWAKADIYFERTWNNDWSDIAEEYNSKDSFGC